MNLKKLPKHIRVFGNTEWRGKCATEDSEVASFLVWLKHYHPNYAKVCTHIKNEGARTYGQARYDKSMGMSKGFADIVILSTPALAIEAKRKDHTKSKLSDEQIEHLSAVREMGGFACVALGLDGMKEAFQNYLILHG